MSEKFLKNFYRHISLCYNTLSYAYQNFLKNFCKNIWWFKKNAILLSFGEVAEWSIAAVLKTVELRGSGGSNPSLSARSQCKTDGESHPFCFLCALSQACLRTKL